EVPPPEQLGARLESVLRVVYLIFNEGYAATEGRELVRADLCVEALQLSQVLIALGAEGDRRGPARLGRGEQAELLGLRALMLLHHSRRRARVDERGDVVVLEQQDRARWDHQAIALGLELLDRALTLRSPGPYQIQAAIAALHARAPTPADTDWAQIAALYGALLRAAPSPVIELNRAVAVAMAEGPEVGLELLGTLERGGALEGYHLLPAARADLLRRAGRHREAIAAYEQALDLARNAAERRYLSRRVDELTP
ncbi:MAG: RNA polymerase subunit sigma-24, partial [Myxococcales bacterium]|nr:RNA polymerase subunit sigma-24 [Myxococcales bacterium]